MEKLVIKGGNPISGEISVHGSKNSALPMLAATILSGGESTLFNCPQLSDINAACEILKHTGCAVSRNDGFIKVNSSSVKCYDVPENLMGEMRSSIIFLGALLARCKKANMCRPGGCDIGLRPIDLHLAGLRKLGVTVNDEDGYLSCHCQQPLKGAKIVFPFPSVGATENIILAAVTAQGETVINNAATEPEIVDLADYLNKCGADIKGAGSSTIIIQGVKKLNGATHTVIPDRIVAATYLCAAAVTGGELLLKNVTPHHIGAVLPLFEQIGCNIEARRNNIYLKAGKQIYPTRTIRTMPYPGFPTDAAALMMVLSLLADGTSTYIENIFENRFKHVSELAKMGANVTIDGKKAVVKGVNRLYGAEVKATDLRGGAAMVLAGLAATGVTTITELQHIDRGYECIEKSLCSLGADIKRMKF